MDIQPQQKILQTADILAMQKASEDRISALMEQVVMLTKSLAEQQANQQLMTQPSTSKSVPPPAPADKLTVGQATGWKKVTPKRRERSTSGAADRDNKRTKTEKEAKQAKFVELARTHSRCKKCGRYVADGNWKAHGDSGNCDASRGSDKRYDAGQRHRGQLHMLLAHTSTCRRTKKHGFTQTLKLDALSQFRVEQAPTRLLRSLTEYFAVQCICMIVWHSAYERP
ncbi:MAG: hypothetical protein HC938_17385 [Nitrospira sp.]|nr:hypothetical protein [Nitrospira sp.]